MLKEWKAVILMLLIMPGACFDVASDRFEVVLKRERERPRPSLIRACRLLFGGEFMGLAWLRAANTGLGFSGPLLLKVVVDAVQGSSHGQGV